MDLSNFQRKAVLLIFISILVGSILLARKEPLKDLVEKIAVQERLPTTTPKPTIQQIPTTIKIDINTADIVQITKLPGIGPSLANAIIEYRTKHGPFSKIEDLLNVPGIGEKRLSRIRELIELPESTKADQCKPPQKQPAVPGSATKIDLNKATIEQLSILPGIGLKLAQAIIDYRKQKGRFNSLEELMCVPRIGQNTYQKLKEYLYVESTKETIQPAKIYDSRIDPKVSCPYCCRELWEKGKKKREYIRCPHCLKLLNE